MKKNQKKGILFVVIGILCYWKLAGILYGISYSLGDFYYQFYLRLFIPLALIGWGVKLYLSKGDNEGEEINADSSIPSNNDKFNDAGDYLIKSVNKFFIALGLSLFSIVVSATMTMNAKSMSAIKDVQNFSIIISVIGFVISILALLDVKKAGESLKK
jgi:hypothetical protein